MVYGFSGDSISNAESGYEEEIHEELAPDVVRFISRFVDRVGLEGGVKEEHIRQLHQLIPTVVANHIESLEVIHKASQKLPKIHKVSQTSNMI